MPARPYADRGHRLRTRRKALQDAGKLPTDLIKLVELAGVSVSGFQMWERGETWPRDKKKARLAALLEWTDTELDYGPQEPGKQQEMTLHPVGIKEMEVLSLYRALAPDRTLQREVVDYLKAKVGSLHVLQQEVRGDVYVVRPEDQHIAPPPPSRKPRKKTAKPR